MGLGGGPSEWEDYEWVRLPELVLPGDPGYRRRTRSHGPDGGADGPRPAGRRAGTGGRSAPVVEPLARALADWLDESPLWITGAGRRVLLADLDNLRADPVRWRARMAAVVALARQADQVVLAGQGGAVARARPHLAEFADLARAVPDGSDLADHELLRGAAAVRRGARQVVVVSNDGIFAELAGRGPLLVLSPGRAALSSRLAEAAARVVDLADLEERVQLGRELPRDDDLGPALPLPTLPDQPADPDPPVARDESVNRPGPSAARDVPGTGPGLPAVRDEPVHRAEPAAENGPSGEVRHPAPNPDRHPDPNPDRHPDPNPDRHPNPDVDQQPDPNPDPDVDPDVDEGGPAAGSDEGRGPQPTHGQDVPAAGPERPGPVAGRVPVLEFLAPDGVPALEFLTPEAVVEPGPGRTRRRTGRGPVRAATTRRRPSR